MLSGVGFLTVRGRDKKRSFLGKELRGRKEKKPSLLPQAPLRIEHNVCHVEHNSLLSF
jgi:hypothetical protein